MTAGGIATFALVLPGAVQHGADSVSTPMMTPARIAGTAIGVVGVLGIVVFAITGSQASGKFSDVEDTCGGVRCTDAASTETIDSGKRLALVANISAAVGGIGVLVGTALIVFGGDSAAADGLQAGDVRPWGSPHGMGVSVAF